MLEDFELLALPRRVWIRDIPYDKSNPVGGVVDVVPVQSSLDMDYRTQVSRVRMRADADRMPVERLQGLDEFIECHPSRVSGFGCASVLSLEDGMDGLVTAESRSWRTAPIL